MKAIVGVISVLLAVPGAALIYHLHFHRTDNALCAQVESAFEFTVRAPYDRVAPLFGAYGEKAWAKGWDPRFVYPQPPRDVEGEVFTVSHAHGESTWVNTAFDLSAGHVQYVFVFPGAQATTVDIQLSHGKPAETNVRVVYRRTALDASFNSHLKSHGDDTAREWQEAIEKSLGVASN